MKIVLAFCSVAVLTACSTSRNTARIPKSFPAFYKEGHRGARGLMPENTIPAMIKGIATGANVLEVDVYITRDGQVLVAHDPFINTGHSLMPGGRELPKDSAQYYVWHQMDYADIRKIDVGSKYYPLFPQQEKRNTYMPLLGELIDSVEAYTRSHQLPSAIYNIEIKANPQKEGVYQPVPAVLVGKTMDVVRSKKIGNRFYIQSFDIRQLQETHATYPGVTIGFLTGDKKISLQENLDKLGFVPQIYSPHYDLVTRELVDSCHALNMKLVPWTVNEAAAIRRLVDLKVDGIITDYPNLLAEY
ncbi:MAG: glycerophosphodiester phosphodiesterase family protein [Candidatus Pseudobacter hemicellulosilyticus]|uniref:Glycerophosphodiester phosphodiesterase family protein n=1 Tax=Candidatus Pseudobacter hemicellulosilyticus TaxID=3121375 RepID=A0AAJ5WNS6_9BACT|nr:MAG: glycerophosphodiester phosphodiesterase family protein [Pseudobacter sp.]